MSKCIFFLNAFNSLRITINSKFVFVSQSLFDSFIRRLNIDSLGVALLFGLRCYDKSVINLP
jgi:hypothetical protein